MLQAIFTDSTIILVLVGVAHGLAYLIASVLSRGLRSRLPSFVTVVGCAVISTPLFVLIFLGLSDLSWTQWIFLEEISYESEFLGTIDTLGTLGWCMVLAVSIVLMLHGLRRFFGRKDQSLADWVGSWPGWRREWASEQAGPSYRPAMVLAFPLFGGSISAVILILHLFNYLPMEGASTRMAIAISSAVACGSLGFLVHMMTAGTQVTAPFVRGWPHGITRSQGTEMERIGRDLADLLSKVAHDSEVAKVLARRAGFPPEHLPDFKIASAFWSTIVGQAIDGRIGLEALAAEATRQFPHNRDLADCNDRIREVLGSERVRPAIALPDLQIPPSEQPHAQSALAVRDPVHGDLLQGGRFDSIFRPQDRLFSGILCVLTGSMWAIFSGYDPPADIQIAHATLPAPKERLVRLALVNRGMSTRLLTAIDVEVEGWKTDHYCMSEGHDVPIVAEYEVEFSVFSPHTRFAILDVKQFPPEDPGIVIVGLQPDFTGKCPFDSPWVKVRVAVVGDDGRRSSTDWFWIERSEFPLHP